jgi:putative ABC transport system permease protein
VFWTYLRRELRRRIRQAIFIALGLALGIGLVITVTAATSGVKSAQATVLHALYGVGTDLTITEPPAAVTSGGFSFGFSQEIKALRKQGEIAPGSKISVNRLANTQYGTLSSRQLASVARQSHVTEAVGALSLTDVTVNGTVPALHAGEGSVSSSFTTNTFTVDGVDVAHSSPGPLGSVVVTSGHAFTQADATADDAVADSGYATANKLKTGSVVSIGGTNFKIIGIVAVPQGGSPPDLYIPLARAQSVATTTTVKLAGEVNTIYVSASEASDITAVQAEITKLLPTATVTDEDDLAKEVTGSIGNVASLADNLGKWLSVAVLVAAFGLAILLTLAAVSRRVREFGTLKALGWRTSRIVGQVLGESLVVGIVGGAAGVGLGYGGAALIDALAPKLSAASPGTDFATSGTSVLLPASSVLGKLLQQIDSATTREVYVTLTAPVTLSVILLAVALAVAGGLLAGLFGGWRVARLRPAVALAKVE